MKIVIPKEHSQYLGYYHIPGIDYAVVSPSGKFINLRTGNFIKVSIDSVGYHKVAICDNNNNNDRYHHYSIHRLLAITFIDRPLRHLDKDYPLLEVNHIDGNKGNNNLLNLEWVTPKENVNHALRIGLMPGKRVIAKHILNGELIKFNNIVECSREFKINLSRLSRHLRSSKAGMLTKRWHVFKYDNNAVWPVLTNTKLQENAWDVVYGMWYAKNIYTSDIVHHDILTGLCDCINIPYIKVAGYVTTNGGEVIFDDWLIWYDDTPLESAIRTLAARRVPDGLREAIKVKYVSNSTGIETIYDSVTKASSDLGISIRKLTSILNDKGGILEDGKIVKLN